MDKYAPIQKDDQLHIGEDKFLDFTVEDSAGAAQNISGWTLSWELRSDNGVTVLVTKVPAIVSGPAGTCRVTVAATDTSGLTAGTYTQYLLRVDAGAKSVLAYGPVQLQTAKG